jgi:hypothetical protein
VQVSVSKSGYTISPVSTRNTDVVYFNIPPPDPGVGDEGEDGGIIFYDKGSYSDGWRYLEAARSDLPGYIWWGGGNVEGVNAIYVDGTFASVGAGKNNTARVVARLGTASPLAGTTYAAYLCANFSNGNKNDWFLPSADELSVMYYQRSLIGGFKTNDPSEGHNFYWSSTERVADAGWAGIVNFKTGAYSEYGKSSEISVRPIRRF